MTCDHRFQNSPTWFLSPTLPPTLGNPQLSARSHNEVITRAEAVAPCWENLWSLNIIRDIRFLVTCWEFTTVYNQFLRFHLYETKIRTKSYFFEMLERYFVKTYKTYNAETKDAHMTRYYYIRLCRWNLCDFLLLLPGISKCRRNFLWFRGKESRSSAPLAIQIFYIFYILYLWIKFICGGKEFRSTAPLAFPPQPHIFYRCSDPI